MDGPRQFPFRPAAVLRLRGEDAGDFLHSQATQDLRGREGFCRYSLFLDHKGLVHGDGFVFREGPESYLILSYATPAEDLRNQLDKHIIAEEVEMEDVTEEFTVLAFTGPLPKGIPDVGEDGQFGRWNVGHVYRGRRLQREGVELLLPSVNTEEFSVAPLSENEAENLRIENGLPLVGIDVGKENNPLEAGILSAIAFDKGCYLGQEVVARLHRLQRVNRRLVRFRTSVSAPVPGTEIRMEEKVVGNISSAVADPERGDAVGMAMVKARIDDEELKSAAGWTQLDVVEPS